ncbi:MAG: GAF domain-containing protein, partial [Prolixibacteraceae bacterium]|nr:GAF domain-containing protein [Prolixibacteraceae bacterium]
KTENIQEFLDYALTEAIQLTDSKIGYIYLYNEEKKQFILNSWSKEVMLECRVADPQSVYDLDKTGCWGEAVRQRKPIIINDYSSGHDLARGIPEGHVFLKKFLTIPVFDNSKIVAVVGVANKKTNYTETDVKQLTLLMDYVWNMVVKLRQHVELVNYKNKLEVLVRDRTKELEEATHVAEQSANAKSVFLANMSHEIRTPMNSIIGYSQILANRVTDPTNKDYLNSIVASGNTLLSLINKILDLSKIEAGKMDLNPEPVNIEQTISEIVSIFKLAANEKGINLSVKIQQGFPELLILDELRIRQIFINLLGNSVKFTDSGFVTITAWYENSGNNSVNCRFIVEDSGIGIKKEELDHIFESFQQSRENKLNSQKGSGLGLAITKKLVELMNGNIFVESEPNIRTEFTILLNNIQFPNTLPKTQDEEITPGSIKFEPATVLVADDSDDNKKVIKEMLADYNLKVFGASNGLEAINYSKEEKIDLILMDISMPEMDGYTAANQIHNNPETSHIPIIAYTATAFDTFGKVLKSKGFAGYLRKPVLFENLISELAKHLKHKTLNGKHKKEAEPGGIDISKLNKNNLVKLKEQFRNTYSELTPRFSHRRTKIFAARFYEKSVELDCSELVKFSREFRKSIENFDIEKSRFMLKELEKIFN